MHFLPTHGSPRRGYRLPPLSECGALPPHVKSCSGASVICLQPGAAEELASSVSPAVQQGGETEAGGNVTQLDGDRECI